MIGCLRTHIHKQPIIALCFGFENELKFYNLQASCDPTEWAIHGPKFKAIYMFNSTEQKIYLTHKYLNVNNIQLLTYVEVDMGCY